MHSMHAPHFPARLTIWGMVGGVIIAPITILGTLFLLVKDVIH